MGGDLLSESWEGAGEPAGWDDNVGVGSTVDYDNTDVARPPSGGNKVLKIQKVSPNFNASTTYDDLPNEYDTHYATSYFQVAAEGLSDGEWLPIFQAYNSTAVVWEIRLRQVPGGDRKFYSAVYNNGGWDFSSDSVALNNDQWYRLDFKYDTGSTWEFRVDEGVLGSATLEGTLRDSPGYWRIGNQGTSETLTAYYDLVNVDSSGYVSFVSDKLSNDAESKLLAHIFKNTQYSQPGNLYIALCKSTIEDDDTGSTLPSEISGGAYSRKQCNTWDTSTTPGTAENDVTITFPKATAGWGTVTDFAICDAQSAGNVICYGKFTTARNIGNGDRFIIDTGDLEAILS